MEMAGSVVKNYVKSNNKTFKLNNVKTFFWLKPLEKSMKTSGQISLHKLKKEEGKFWNKDMVVDHLFAGQQTVVMTMGNSEDCDLLSDSHT